MLMADQLYGEYLDKVRAVLDAIETAEESRLEKQPRRAVSRNSRGEPSRGIEVEVWDESSRLY